MSFRSLCDWFDITSHFFFLPFTLPCPSETKSHSASLTLALFLSFNLWDQHSDQRDTRSDRQEWISRHHCWRASAGCVLASVTDNLPWSDQLLWEGPPEKSPGPVIGGRTPLQLRTLQRKSAKDTGYLFSAFNFVLVRRSRMLFLSIEAKGWGLTRIVVFSLLLFGPKY